MPPHFRHLIQWHDLLWCCLCPASNSSNTVYLPTGTVCQKIHLLRRRDELVVQHHKYLQPLVCNDPKTCSSQGIVRTRGFVKGHETGKVKKYKVNSRRTRDDQPVEVLQLRFFSFLHSFFHALEEVGEADLQREHDDRKQRSLEEIVQEIQASEGYDDFWSARDCEIVYQLLLRNRPDLVLEGHRRGLWDLEKTFSTNFGGQFVGNFWTFLLYHVMTVYIDTNLYIAAADDNLDMVEFRYPYVYYGCSLLSDCDGRTFLHTWRYALQEGVYLKDMNATMDMLRGCFRFLANLYIVLDSCGNNRIRMSDHFTWLYGIRCKGNCIPLVFNYE